MRPSPDSHLNRVAQLRAEARYRAERLGLYRAKVHGPRATSTARLRELTREHEIAVARLKRAATETMPRAPSGEPPGSRGS